MIKNVDYDIDFKINQRLSILWQDLSVTSSVLSSTIRTAQVMHTHGQELMNLKPYCREECLMALRHIKLNVFRLEDFQQNAEALLKRTEDCSKLVRLNSGEL